jgi:hypothetical protein
MPKGLDFSGTILGGYGQDFQLFRRKFLAKTF